MNTCKYCKKEFAAKFKDRTFCDSKECGEAFYKEKSERRAHDFWLLIPTQYQETEFSKLNFPAISQRILDWEPDDTKGWLYVFGPTGAGKTRTIYLRCKKFAFEGYDPDDIKIIRGNDFRNEVVERTRPREKGEENPGRLKDYMEPLKEASLLWLDEVDKVKFSERVEDEFFDLLEYRASHMLTTMFSGACGPQKLAAKLSPDDSPQIIRRLVQNSVCIKFPPLTVKPPQPVRQPIPTEKIVSESSNEPEHENEDETEAQAQ